VIDQQQNDDKESEPTTEPASVSRQNSPDPANDPRNTRLITWFKRWRKPIRQWLSHRSSVPTADLDDLAQEVFLRCGYRQPAGLPLPDCRERGQ
jgi:hypothetical protein